MPLSTTVRSSCSRYSASVTSAAPTIVTSNLPFDEWTTVFGSERLTGALLDRLTHHVHILEMNGDSYRLKTEQATPASDVKSRLAVSLPRCSDLPSKKWTGFRPPIARRALGWR